MHKTKTVFMYSGQGSQYFQMGRAMYEQNPTFRTWMLRMDNIVHQVGGYSVISEIYNEARLKSELFDRMLHTHPAIFMIEYALTQALLTAGIVPDIVLGASLGSFAAATVAQSITLEDSLTAIVKQASLTEQYCPAGGMIAVLADPAIAQQGPLAENGVVASYNFASHFVLSAPHAALDGIEAHLRENGITFQRLPVGYAFHSPWIEEAKQPFQAALAMPNRQPAQLPIACCVSADLIHTLPQHYFWQVAREPIHFQQLATLLESQGSYQYIDVGPAGTLATFLKYSLPPGSQSKTHAILSPYGRDMQNFAALTAALK